MHLLKSDTDDLTRRQFVVNTAKSCLGVSLLSGAEAAFGAATTTGSPKGKATSVIYLFMAGGMSHLDTLDPKPDMKEVMGETKTIATNAPGIRFGHWLPQLARHADKLTVMRSITSTQGAHEPAQYVARTNYRPLATIEHPAMGSWALQQLGRRNQLLPGYVNIGGGSRHPGAGFMPTEFEPLPIGDPDRGLQHIARPEGVDEAAFSERLSKLEQFNSGFLNGHPLKDVKGYQACREDAVRLMKSEDVKAFDLSRENARTRERYGSTPFGQGCLLARRLVEKGVRFIEVNSPDWDHHNQIYTRLPEKTRELDAGLSALLADLQTSDLLESTLVVVGSEFGRGHRFSPTIGRSHHPKCFSGILAGGGVKGGYVHGASDERGDAVAEQAITIQDFNATVMYAQGIDLDAKVISPSKRPFTPADKGRPVSAVFA
jgi:hypothetical protein